MQNKVKLFFIILSYFLLITIKICTSITLLNAEDTERRKKNTTQQSKNMRPSKSTNNTNTRRVHLRTNTGKDIEVRINTLNNTITSIIYFILPILTAL
jgi:hypothetical protein